MGLVRTFSLVLGATASITCSADDPAGWFEAWRAGRLGWFEAARAGEVTTLEVALQAGTSVDQTDEHGLTALMLAAGAGRTEAVKALLRGAASADFESTHAASKGWTPLMFAAGSGHTAASLPLLHAGAKLNSWRSEQLGKLLNKANPSLHAPVQAKLSPAQRFLDDIQPDPNGDHMHQAAAKRREAGLSRFLSKHKLEQYLGKLSEEGIKGPMDLAFVAHADQLTDLGIADGGDRERLMTAIRRDRINQL